MSDQDMIKQLDETLPFLTNDRLDVRKVALSALAAFSSHAACVDHLLSERTDSIRHITALLVPGSDLRHYAVPCLKTLINICAFGAAPRIVVEARGVRRTMVLLDKGGLTEEQQELCLWLLANLTSLCPEAITAILQHGDGIQEGYYLSVLLRRFTDDTMPREELVLQTDAKPCPFVWRYGDVLRNCAQSPVGRRLLLDDPEGLSGVGRALGHEEERVRIGAIGILRNILVHKETHPLICDPDKTTAAVEILRRLGMSAQRERGCERSHAVLVQLIEAASTLTGSDPGVKLIDAAGGKAIFSQLQEIMPQCRDTLEKAIAQCDDVQDVVVSGPGAQEMLEPGSAAKKALPKQVCAAVDAARAELGSLTAPGVVTDHERTLATAQRLTQARYRLHYEHAEVYPSVYPPPAAGDGSDVFKACDEAGEGSVTRKEIAKYLMRNQSLRHRLREGWAAFNANFGTEDTPENHSELQLPEFRDLWLAAARMRADHSEEEPAPPVAVADGDDEERMGALD